MFLDLPRAKKRYPSGYSQWDFLFNLIYWFIIAPTSQTIFLNSLSCKVPNWIESSPRTIKEVQRIPPVQES